MVLVKPGNPEKSYLIKKIRHDPDIAGNLMPLGGKNLSSDDIQIISNWIASLSENMVTNTIESKSSHVFACWTVGNTPTTEVLEKGRFLFAIKHRFAPKIEKYNNLFGIDRPTIIMFSLGYAVTNDFMVTVGRTNAFDDIEINARYHLLEYVKNKFPFSLALKTTINWESLAMKGKKSF